jgi:hypothetical protein
MESIRMKSREAQVQFLARLIGFVLGAATAVALFLLFVYRS